MAFQYKLYKCTGANCSTETDTSKSFTFLSSDIHGAAASYPVPVPATGDPDNNSYETFLKLKCTTPPDNYVENIKVWGPSTNPGTGVMVWWGITDTDPVGGPVNTTSPYAGTRQDLNNYQQGNALVWTTPQASDRIVSANDYSDSLVMQLRVASSGSSGNMEDQTYSLSWDES